MIDLGVATSIAKDNQYSWQDTVNFANSLDLNTIQFYVPRNKIIPKISNIENFNNIYLHLPNDYYTYLNESVSGSTNFVKLYKSNKIIIHQNESISNKKYLDLIKNSNQAGLLVGIENDGGKDLYSYSELIKYLNTSEIKPFAVIDVHRFFHDYFNKYKEDFILDEILKLLVLCKRNNINIVLHIIDSKSFNSDHNMWVPFLNGSIPYSRIFEFISNKNIIIESLVFEYESKGLVLTSVKNFKKYYLF
jgi:hypothetical protein